MEYKVEKERFWVKNGFESWNVKKRNESHRFWQNWEIENWIGKTEQNGQIKQKNYNKPRNISDWLSEWINNQNEKQQITTPHKIYAYI